MLAQLRVPWAFLVRDFRDDASYKIGFLFRVATAVINVAISTITCRSGSSPVISRSIHASTCAWYRWPNVSPCSTSHCNASIPICRYRPTPAPVTPALTLSLATRSC